MELTTLLILFVAMFILLAVISLLVRIVKAAIILGVIGVILISAVFYINNDRLPTSNEITGAVTSTVSSIEGVNETIEKTKEKTEQVAEKAEKIIVDTMKGNSTTIAAPTITIR